MALNLDSYGKTQWEPTMPITQGRMDNLENGVYVNREAIKSLDSTVDSATSSIQSLNTAIAQRPTITEVNSLVEQGSGQGTTALTAITSATTEEELTYGGPYASLAGRFRIDEGLITAIKQALGQTVNSETNEISDIYSSSNTVASAIEAIRRSAESILAEVRAARVDDIANPAVSYQSLYLHLKNIDSNVDVLMSNVSTILAAAGQNESGENIALTQRFAELANLKTEVEAAHRAVEEGQTPDTLAKRFGEIESAVSSLRDNKVNVADIIDDLVHNDSNKPLSANMGKTLKDTIGGTYSPTNTVASAIATAQSTAESNAESYTNSLLGNGFSDQNTVTDITDELDNRVTDAEAELRTAHTSSVITEMVEDEETHEMIETNKEYDSIDSRFEAIETHKKAIADEIAAARTSTVIRTEVPAAEEGEDPTYIDTTYGSLDARLEAIEARAAAARNDVDTIAAELRMTDITDKVVETTSRIDQLEENVVAMANEIGMLQDGAAVQDMASAISDQGTRIDTIDTDLNAVKTEIGNAHRTGLVDNQNQPITDTLDNRFDDIETAISGSGGLSERVAAAKAIADANATAISHAVGASGSDDKGGLTERVIALETEPKSATEIVASLPQTGDPNKDYLLGPNEDGKYFYYKWIVDGAESNWKLISGGGSGSGNTSGMDLTAEQYATIKTNHTYAENTDYYVLEEDGIRHHYRYITTTVNDEPTLTEIEIGIVVDTDQIKKYNISRVTGKKREYNSQTQTWTETDEDVEYLNLYQYDYGQDNTIIDTQAEPFAQIELPKGGDGGSSSSQKNTLTRIGTEVIQKVTGSQILLRVFFSSYDATGTESSVGYATLRAGNSVIFSNRELSSYESSVVPNPLTWQENTAGFHEFDVTDYCEAGNTIFTLSVDVGGSAPLGKTWRVNLTELRLESNAPDNLLISVDDEYAFPYIPIGAVNKTLKVTIDKGTQNEQTHSVSIPSTISGTPSTYILDPEDLELAHGKHTIELQLFAQIGGVIEPSNKINREYIWYDISDTDTPIIIASQYEGTTIEALQYATIEIPYQVYKKDTNTINVEYYLDDEETPYQTSTLVNSNTGTLAYIASDVGDHTLKIKVDDVYIAINLAIARSDKDLSPISGMVIDFDPTTLSNSAANRLPTWNTKINGTNYTFGLTASSNFNWSEDINGGGYKKDANGDRCFVIKAGSYVDLNYPMFANDVFSNGAEMKIIFKTSAVRNAEAVWYKNTGEISGKTVGIQLGTHSGWLKTDKAVAASTSADEDEDEGTITIKGITYYYWQPNIAYNPNDVRIIQKIIYRCTKASDPVDYNLEEADLDEDPYKSYMKNWAKVGQLDTEVIATNSYLYFPYSEEDKIELDININKSNTGNDFIMSYEDGVPSKAYAYTTGAGGDKIAHNNTIHIGSNECDVYIYHLRYYVKSLSTDQILQNFIADGKNLNEKVERYDRNCIYWNPYLNDGDGGYTLTKTSQSSLDPIKLAEKMPDVKVLMLDTDVFTTSKKDFIMNSSLRCIHAEGGNIYKSRGDEDNWFFTNGFHAGQGTTSDNYGQSARNVDFLFEVDAKHWPSKEKNMGKYKISENPNYISTVFKGTEASEFANNSWNASYNEWTADTSYIIGDKVSITDTEDNNKGIIYSCTKAHTSDETFDEKNWNKIGTFSKCSDWMADDCKITLTESSVPNNYFNFKANVASSENVNNALFQKRYDDFLVYKSPAQAVQTAKHHDTYENIDDVKVKNCMEFVPAVLFVRENNADLSKHVEFNDCNWHFYALGNIGDSKKTDYTRAYDPDDMNEFTCENSDNNTNNGQFQSGVFTYQGHVGAIETDYTAWIETTAYAQDAIVVYNGIVYTRTGATQEALEEGETYSWVASDWTAITYTGWTDSEPPYFAPRTNPNPMDYTYPISSSQWNVKFGSNYLNRKHMTLVKEKFDGDHSFEFRYACCGDYRDGDRINDTHGDSNIPVDPSDLTKGYKTKDDVQEVLNHDVVLALYEWVITASPEQYVSEASQWFVKSAMEFFYAYTHYYTMMDNRAKNTFWHFAKTGNYIKVSRPVKELLHIYEVPDGNGGYKPTTDTELDPTNPYYTQYAFDLWVYDCDTALGIDNNGALVFPYGKEDEDYRGEDAASGYAFNGAGSIFWRRLKTTFVDEIADVMTRARDCFDPENLINEFDSFQNCFPEEIWRLDIERKYIRTYTGESIDNSITTNKQNARFLMSMMQGRKKYQRRQWVRDQSFYFNSKYKIGEIEVNKTEFNIVSPAGDHSLLAVSPDYHLHLTPYQDMYLNVVVGNGSPIPPIRAKANQEYTIKLDDYTAGNFAETRVYISGFRMISKLGGLAPMYPYAFTLNGLDHLKELDVGTDVSGYLNGNFTELPLTDKVQLPLLEKLNIKNCSSLSTSIGLKTANNLRVVEAAGSSIGGISLPDYTQIEVLHLPVTVTDLILNNARFLKDFSITDITGAENYNNLYTLNIENSDYSGTYVWNENTDYIEGEIRVIGNNVYKCKKDHTSVTTSTQLDDTAWTDYLNTNWTLIKANTKLPIDWIDIATKILQKQSVQTNIQLLGLSSATIINIQELEPFNEFKSVVENNNGALEFSGVIHITGDWSEIERDNYMTVWPQLTFDVSQGTKQNKWKVTYEHDDGTILKTIYVDEGAAAPDIYSTGDLTEMPTKPQTERESYRFGSVNEVSGKYILYSGWHLSSSSQPISSTGTPYVFSNLRIITYFVPIPRTYQIRWYLDKNPDNRLVKSSPGLVSYGGGYDQEAPTVTDIHNANFETCSVTFNGAYVSYKIFNGWEKLPTNINPTANDNYYAIHANWIEANNVSINSLFENTINLTLEQLLVLSAMDAQMKDAYNIDDKIDSSGMNRLVCTMGSDNNVEGIELISTPYRLDQDDNPYTTSIQPLKSGSDAFTLVIDYCFNEEMTESITTNYSTLVNCYYSNTSENVKNGFSLFYGKSGNTISGPRVGFGDIYNSSSQSISVGSDTMLNMRNIIVLRHPANEPTLYIYSGLNGPALSSDVTVTTINYQNYNSNAYLNIGQLGNDADTTDGATRQVSNGKGTIYWMKYWPEDLGQGECKKLASWPHEQITYGVSYLSNNATSTTRAIGNTATSSIHLASLNTLSHGTYYQGRTQESGLGWGNSSLETIINKRVMNGLPIQLQSILCKDSTSYTIGERQDGGQGQFSYELSASGGIVRNYIRPYSLAHVISNEAVYKNAEENTETAPFSWLDLDNIIVYDYGSNGWAVNTSNNASLVNYLNIRFPNKAITWGAGANRMRIFREVNSGTTVPMSTTVANTIYQATNTLKSGDIYIMKRGETEYTFIYATTQEILALGLQPTSTSFDTRLGAPTLTDTRGLWIRAEQYWTRSVIINNGFNFGYVYENGTPNTSITNQVDSRGLKFSQILTI